MHLHQITVRTVDTKVVLLVDGRGVEIPWEHAIAVGKALLTKASEARENAKAAILTADHALCLRAGLPFGVTNRPDIQREAWKEAQYLKFPGVVEPKSQVYKPTILQSPPSSEEKSHAAIN